MADDRARGAVAMADDHDARIAQLEAENAELRRREAVLVAENAELAAERTEAQEQRTATAEILRIITASPTDARPVLDAIAGSAMLLTDSTTAALRIGEGDHLRNVAAAGGFDEVPASIDGIRPLTGRLPSARAFLDRRTIHVPDRSDPAFAAEFPDSAPRGPWASITVPLLRDGAAIGVLDVYRDHVQPYSAREIALLETFADQAVIAIENARLFGELEQRNAELQESNRRVTEALEQQTATAEVLRVIASSPSNLERVLDALMESAVRLCAADNLNLFRLDGEIIRGFVAYDVGGNIRHSWVPGSEGVLVGDHDELVGSRLPDGLVGACAVRERRTIHVPDLALVSDDEYPVSKELARRLGNRTVLAVPLLRLGEAIGFLTFTRKHDARPFTDSEIALASTFADQAVIAIENARLFQELEQRNTDLQESNRLVREALSQQTATAEVLRVIASSPTDLGNVLNTIVESAARLCRADNVGISRVVGNEYERVANLRQSPGPSVGQRLPLDRDSMSGRAILEKCTLNIHDVQAIVEQEYPVVAQNQRHSQQRLGPTMPLTRSILMIPLIREGAAVGSLAVSRTQVRPFTDEETALLEAISRPA